VILGNQFNNWISAATTTPIVFDDRGSPENVVATIGHNTIVGGATNLVTLGSNVTGVERIANRGAFTQDNVLGGNLAVPDDAYGAGWNGSTNVPTKNAVYDKIETLGSQTPWNSDINAATFALTNLGSMNFGGTTVALDAVAGILAIDGLGGGANENFTLDLNSTANRLLISSSTGATNLTLQNIDLRIPTRAYAASWDGDATASARDDVFDKFAGLTIGTDTAGNYAAGDAEAGNALTGDSATAFFSAGQIERARGGTGADTSAYGAGIFGSDAGNLTIDIDTLAEVDTAIGITGTADATTFWRGDNSWAAPAGGGAPANTIVGPGGTVDNSLPRMNGTSGTNIQSSPIIMSDAGALTGIDSVTATNGITAGSFTGTGSGAGALRLDDTDASHHYRLNPTGVTTTSINHIMPAAPLTGIPHYVLSAATNLTESISEIVSADVADGTLTASDLGTDSVSADELNATGVEAELEAVLDLDQLQGAVTDGQVPNTITIDLATTATTANAGDSATAFFSSGQIERARGGTGADTSAYGLSLLGSDAGNSSVDVDTLAEFDTALGISGTPDATTFWRGDNTWAGAGAADNLGNHLATQNLNMATFAVTNATHEIVDGTDATSFVVIVDAATGNLALKTDAGLPYAADSGTLNPTVLTESGNAVFNSSETPGGELGGTWASPTIDDTVTVDGWVMGASTATTPAASDNDTSLATSAFVTSSTTTFTGKTYDASGTGNVLKQTKQLILQRPDYGDGAGAVPQTNSYTASGLMHFTFSGAAETNGNWTVYEFDTPSDLDTAVEMTARFAFISGGTDADDYVFHITYDSQAAGGAYVTGTAIDLLPIVMTVTPTTPASGDLQQSSATTLTGWAAALTAGRPMQVRVARLQNTQDDSARDVQLVITYASTL
jgi:hypothetical protein